MTQATALLDKGVVRRLFESERRRLSTRPLTPEQRRCVVIFNGLLEDRARIYVTEATFAVIHRIPSRSRSALAAECLRLEKGKYLKRWARRLQGFGFSAEDARVLSYASFGLDRQAKQLGVEMVITADRKLVERFLQHRQAIVRRFHAMTVQLGTPYQEAQLPTILCRTEKPWWLACVLHGTRKQGVHLRKNFQEETEIPYVKEG